MLAPGTPLTFVHPIVRSVVYEDLSAGQIERLHRLAASALAREDAPLDAITPHLLRVEPASDPWVRATLASAAADARRGGAPAVAAEYLRRALLEAPPQDERVTLLHALAAADFDARGKPAIAGFEAALDAAQDPRTYGTIALDLGRALHVLGDHPQAARVYDRAFEGLGETDSDLARALEAEAIIAALQDFSTASIAAARLPGAASRLGRGGAPDAMVTAALALVTAAGGDPGAAALADRALASGELDRVEHLQSLALACFVLVWADRLDDAARVWETRAADFRRDASLPALSFACCFAAQTALLRGDPRGRRRSRASRSGGGPERVGADAAGPGLLSGRSAPRARRHSPAPSRSSPSSTTTRALPERQGYNTLLLTRARVRIAQHRRDEALSDLLELGRRMERWGVRNPAAYPWRSTAAWRWPATTPRGPRELAAVEVERARAFGAPRALGIALRGAGLVAGRGGDRPAPRVRRDARGVARAARAWRGRSPRSGRRCDGRAAEARRSRACARRSPSPRSWAGWPWPTTSARSLSPPVRDHVATPCAGRDALTASERRVAELAAGGLTNRQIAQKLFVTLRTVETHLTSAYRKLDVQGRDELAKTSW